jgi:hypothetical protein
VAFSEYEVSTCEQLLAALQHGLEHHRAGAVLVTEPFERRRCELTLSDAGRVRVLRHFGPEAAAALADWVRLLGTSDVAK